MKRKIISTFMTLIICMASLAYVIEANAESQSLRKVNDENIEKLITTVALDWARIIEPDKDFIVSDIIEIYSEYSEQKEYTASLFFHTMPYGYVVIGFSDNEAVVNEAKISPGQEGLYADIIDIIDSSTDLSRSDITVDDAIVKIAPLQYALTYEDENGNEYATDNYGNDLSSDVEHSNYTEYESSNSIYIAPTNWTSDRYKVDESTRVLLAKHIQRGRLLSQQEVERLTHSYACPVQALYQVAYMEKIITCSDSDVKSNYPLLWKYCKIEEHNFEDGVSYGEGYKNEYVPGFVEYAKSKGYTNTSYGMLPDPSVAWIEDKLLRNYPTIMAYGINVNGERNGHVISILGYMKAKKLSSGNTWNYFKVYDGWNSSACYLNYSTVDFMDCSAAFFRVSK